MAETPMVGILIHRPIHEVFQFVMAIEETPYWRPRMSELAWIDDHEPGLGGRFRVTVKTLASPPEITRWDPPHAVSYRVKMGSSELDSHMEWITQGDKACRFLMGGEPRPRGVWKLVTPMLGRSILRQNTDDLVRLKGILESRPRRSVGKATPS